MKDLDFIYLDHAAATPVSEKVQIAMQPYFAVNFFNPSSPYAPAVEVRREYEQAKSDIAGCIGAKASEIIITAGATESINLAINGVGGHVVVSAIEHESVLAVAKRGDHSIVSVDKNGRVSPEDIRNAINDDTRLVSIGLANGEIGTIQPISEIAQIIKEIRQERLSRGSQLPIYLHTDASQGTGLLDIQVSRLGVDLLTLNAGKIYGPKQVGLLWADRLVMLDPQIRGGGQERGLRSGTENVAGTVGFAKAIEVASKSQKVESRRLAGLRSSLEDYIVGAVPDAVVSGGGRRLSSHLHISFPGIDGERLVFALEERGVYVATGSACAANRGTRSHVLEAIGLSAEVADGSLRLSLGRLSNEDNTEEAGKIIVEEVLKERKRVGL